MESNGTITNNPALKAKIAEAVKNLVYDLACEEGVEFEGTIETGVTVYRGEDGKLHSESPFISISEA